jgi:uncharacterized protein with NAD-binding domain and iron-sulfur cluster
MMGPTTECWVDPWEEHLVRQGVRFEFGTRVERLELDGGRIARAWMRDENGRRFPIEADAFVLAVPLEAAHRLVDRDLANADEELAKIARVNLDEVTAWMTGAQFFLSEDVPLCEGHLFLPSSPWSLTVISQAQFWNRGARMMSRYGDGRLRGIVSVDISSCFTPDRDGVRLVDERSREGILERVFAQLLEAVDPAQRRALERAVYAANLDHELTVDERGVTNAGRLLVHPPGSRALRPKASSGLSNLHFAADYVLTSMDLASMEGANEAGRRAARAVLERAGMDASKVRLFAYDEVDRLTPLRALDAVLYSQGVPHLVDLAERALDVVRDRVALLRERLPIPALAA